MELQNVRREEGEEEGAIKGGRECEYFVVSCVSDPGHHSDALADSHSVRSSVRSCLV